MGWSSHPAHFHFDKKVPACTAGAGSGTFLTQWGYNSGDMLGWIKYPGDNVGGSGEQVNYTYLPQGSLNAVSGTDTYLIGSRYDTAGRLLLQQLGNSRNTEYSYYAWNVSGQGGRLKTIKTGTAATGTALGAGTAAVNAAGGAASYLARGFSQNAVDAAMGNTPTFQPTFGGVVANAAFAGVISPAVGNQFPVANNTMRTLLQASYFMAGMTVPTLFATQNARHMYTQAAAATGLGSLAGFGNSEWEQPR